MEKVRAMTKRQAEQKDINTFCEAVFESAMKEFDSMGEFYSCERLRTCQAMVYETENYFILKSYDTFVAVVCKIDNSRIDVLRYVYGYTATSAQHISKFFHDFAPYPCNSPRYTYRDI